MDFILTTYYLGWEHIKVPPGEDDKGVLNVIYVNGTVNH